MISCSKDSVLNDDIPLPENPLKTKSVEHVSGLKVINGTLHFDSLEVISLFVNSQEKMTDSELFEWEETNNFYSLYHAIYNAENDIFSDSLLFESKLEKYKDLVYLDENDCVKPQIITRFYQLICNNEGCFYVGSYKHRVTPKEIIVENPKLRSIERRSYITSSSVQTRAEENPRFPLASSSWTGGDRRVNVNVLYYRNLANENGKWQGQQVLHIWSEAYKKSLGKYRSYQTLHSHDVLGFYCANTAYKKTDGTYGTRVVRYEGLSGGGSVGEVKNFGMWHYLTPYNSWIPELYIPTKESDIYFVQVRAKTRGTGDNGAVVNYVYNTSVSLPFSIPTNGAVSILRPLVTQNF